MPAPVEITLTPGQARYLQHRLQRLEQAALQQQEAHADAAELLGFAAEGHAPAHSTFVSINTETGVLVVQPPEP